MFKFVSPIELAKHFAATGSTVFPGYEDFDFDHSQLPLLDGVNVLDLTVFEAGPSGAEALAQRGANVVKIERPGTGDPARSMFGPGKDSPYFVIYNLNKRSVTINLKSPEGKALFLSMVPHFDVVIENYGPGVMDELGLGYEALKAVHDEIIFASIKGFGSTGPYARYNCFDMIAQAAAAAYAVNGPQGGPPMRCPPTTADSGTGTLAYGEVCAALFNRLRGRGGRFIDVSMHEAMITNAMRTLAAMTNFGEEDIGRIGNGHDNNPFIDMYECGGKTGDLNNYIYIAAMGAPMADAVCRVIGADDLVRSPKVATFEAQKENEPELRKRISQWALQQDKKEASALLRDAGVPAFHIVAPHELFEDQHLLERGYIQTINQPGYGEIPVFNRPGNDGSEVQIVPAPLLGQHTFDVLLQLGWSAKSIVDLHERGVIGHEVAKNPNYLLWQQQYGISSGMELRL